MLSIMALILMILIGAGLTWCLTGPTAVLLHGLFLPRWLLWLGVGLVLAWLMGDH